MTPGRGIIIAGALIAAAILARSAWTQGAGGTTYPPVLAYVVATCGTAPTVNTAGTGWQYAANSLAPLTMNVSGSLCVNQ